jgi:hypothetical protein
MCSRCNKSVCVWHVLHGGWVSCCGKVGSKVGAASSVCSMLLALHCWETAKRPCKTNSYSIPWDVISVVGCYL